MRVSDARTEVNERVVLLRTDALLSTLRSKTPEEIAAWVQSNVNTVSDVKDVLTKLLLVVRTLQ